MTSRPPKSGDPIGRPSKPDIHHHDPLALPFSVALWLLLAFGLGILISAAMGLVG